MILKDLVGVLHVLIVTPMETRIKAIMEQEGVSREIAERRVNEHDKTQSSYFRRYFKINWLDCNLYDLVINAGRIKQNIAVEMIVKAARELS
ncbi:MAG: Cytidylate kinase [Syntrophomonadaceae bacterium]|nr:Cytidylate kinase [Bacillota bacterium]